MEYQDYYAALGVPKTATEKEIRSAFRKLAREHHPDVNPNNAEAEARFKTVNEAYQVLSDPEKRKQYDELGSRWQEYQRYQQQGPQSGQPGFDWDSFMGGQQRQYRTVSEDDLRDIFGEGEPYSDFFSTFFGGGQRRGTPRPRAGADLEATVEVSFSEAARGTTRQLNLTAADGMPRRIEVTIPPGVETGSRIRVAGQGVPGRNGGQAGDLYLVTVVQPDPRFVRNGDEVTTRVDAPLATFVLGGEVRVPTPDGRTLALTVPAGAADGRLFRLRGQGMAKLGAGKGDLIAELHVQLPAALTDRQRDLFRAFADSLEPAGRQA